MRHVDDIIVLIKEKDVKLIHKRLNSLDQNIKCTIDNLPNDNVHFLKTQIDKNYTSIYYKSTHTGQYTHSQINTPCARKTVWIKASFD